jgi:radical SAM superfamily enzyme
LLPELNARGIAYEISLIYGLPLQTLDTFKESIDFVLNHSCNNLVAYPLMLLRGTGLHEQRSQFGLKEEILGDFNIPTVTSSHSFTKDDWSKMKDIAESLNPKNRF